LSKKYQEKAKLLTEGKFYSPAEAVKTVKQTAWAKFDESVDLALKLVIEPKKGNVSVRGFVPLPHGSGKSVRVAVITKPERVAEAEEAGANPAGAEDLIEKISKGFTDFDVLLATPDVMGQVGKLGKILGTKGLMPNPKSGTVTAEIKKAISEFKAGKFEFRMDKGSVVHILLGKVSFPEEHLLANLGAAVKSVLKAKPPGTKGSFIRSVTVSSTMGPGVSIDPRSFVE
jgi:large subunit ribosomal protein L1